MIREVSAEIVVEAKLTRTAAMEKQSQYEEVPNAIQQDRSDRIMRGRGKERERLGKRRDVARYR